jgi:hypothetical protein
MSGLDGMITIETAKYRPCLVYGYREALFHRWVEADSISIKFNIPISYDGRKTLAKEIIETNIYPHYADPVVVKRIVGLIEYRDGTIDMVEPKDVRFLDSDYEFENVEASFERERMR